MRPLLHCRIISRFAGVSGVLLLGVILILSGCDNPKGACTRGSGISRSCGDDFTQGQCGLVNGRFHEGRTCRDLGFSGRNTRGAVEGMGRTFHLALSDVSDPVRPVVIGTAIVTQAVQETPFTVIQGNVPITLQIKDMIDPDGRPIHETYHAVCPSATPMPEVMIVDAGDWLLYADPESERITAVFESIVENQNATFRLDMDAGDYESDSFSFPVSGELLVNWHYRSGEPEDPNGCAFGVNGGIAVEIDITE